jgi:hypothetical protein
MENHPHDSICGCSVSDVHREVLFSITALFDGDFAHASASFLNQVDTRFAKARQVGEQLVSTAFASFFRHFVDSLGATLFPFSLLLPPRQLRLRSLSSCCSR